MAAALEDLRADGQEVRLGPLLWHLADGLRGRARGDEGVNVLVGAAEAVSLALAAERSAWGRDDVVRITGGEYQGRAGLIDVPVWQPDHDGQDIEPGLPRAYRVRLDGAVTADLPAGQLRLAAPESDPDVYMAVAFPSVWVGAWCGETGWCAGTPSAAAGSGRRWTSTQTRLHEYLRSRAWRPSSGPWMLSLLSGPEARRGWEQGRGDGLGGGGGGQGSFGRRWRWRGFPGADGVCRHCSVTTPWHA
ncbi:hypothetical protein ACFV0O_41070 [Kitasatospora sp. NPDC059577]|uniref:hypothetical protein n=1 Tax=Kitasatospora sp. NPDC059577 TaxID=3346873 RepID=UPI0036AB3685